MPSKKPRPAPPAGVAAYHKKVPAAMDSQNDARISAPTTSGRGQRAFADAQSSSVVPPREAAVSKGTRVAEHLNLSNTTHHRKAVATQAAAPGPSRPVGPCERPISHSSSSRPKPDTPSEHSPAITLARDRVVVAKLSECGVFSQRTLDVMVGHNKRMQRELMGPEVELPEQERKALENAIESLVLDVEPRKIRPPGKGGNLRETKRWGLETEATALPAHVQGDPRLRGSRTPEARPNALALPSFAKKLGNSRTKPTTTATSTATSSAALSVKSSIKLQSRISDQPATANKEAVTLKAVKKFPPLVVERLPNWVDHLRHLTEKLGRTLNVRPYGKGLRFLPKDQKEFRLVRSYLTSLEKENEPPIEWFTYGLPGERCLKVAIRGLPSNTPPQYVEYALRRLGYKPKAVRCVHGSRGSCVFIAVMQHTKNLIPSIYSVTELLCVEGIKIESWRGNKKPAQCYRCQSFRHSSYNCHRRMACVICGGEHAAYQCPRPSQEPATCVNCCGPHPANYHRCPVRLREVQNKKAGTVALSVECRVFCEDVEQQVEEETLPTSLMDPEIELSPCASPVQEIKKKKKKKRSHR